MTKGFLNLKVEYKIRILIDIIFQDNIMTSKVKIYYKYFFVNNILVNIKIKNIYKYID